MNRFINEADNLLSNTDVPPPPPPPNSSDSDDTGKILIIAVAVVGLLVIGSVLTAAFFYINLPEGGTVNVADGDLIYDEEGSHPERGSANFTLILDEPSRVDLANTEMRILNSEGEDVTSQIEGEWISVNSDQEHLKSGDILSLSSSKDISGYEVLVTIEGEYRGIISSTIPST